MPLVRMIVSSKTSATALSKDAIVNTLYFNVSGSIEDPDYQGLVDDLYALWAARDWSLGRYLDIRAYDMGDAEPRPVKASKMGSVAGTAAGGPAQVALCLSYYADRNLPGMRGRIYLGPWSTSVLLSRPSTGVMGELRTFGLGLAGIGGLNVDWSLYSPTRDDATRISDIWVDNSWDIIRSRKLSPTDRVTAEING